MGLEDDQAAPQWDVHSFKENLRVHGIGDHSLQFQLPEPTAFELCCEGGTEEKDELHVLPPFIEVTLDPVYVPPPQLPSPSPPLCGPASTRSIGEESTAQATELQDCLTRAPLHPIRGDVSASDRIAMNVQTVSVDSLAASVGSHRQRPGKRKRRDCGDDDDGMH